MTQGEIRSGPVFVVGMNGSGTTMLLDNLGRHPDLYAFPKETRLIPHFIATVNRYGDLDDDSNLRRLWADIAGAPVFRQVNGGQSVPLPDDWASMPRSLQVVLDRLFLSFAQREGKSRWCEKTPQHVQHIESLATVFPTARFVHMIRDGRDCAASFQRRWKRTPELTMYRWKNVVRMGRRAGEALGHERYLEVRYEDLTTSPEPWLRRICEFLGLPFDPCVMESSRPYLDVDGNPSGTGLQANSGKWRRQFSPIVQERLERIGGTTLAAFGYATEWPESDENPGRAQRRLWSMRDAAFQFGREVTLKLRGELERPWSVIFAKPLTALRQRRQNRY